MNIKLESAATRGTQLILTTTMIMTDTATKPRIAFWGTDDFILPVLNALEAAGLSPLAVVTTPDRLLGRKKIPTSSPAKAWAEARNIPVYQPESLKNFELSGTWDLFIVASYGKIIPDRIVNAPRRGTLNIHPSLLPKYRGPSPIPTSLLDNEIHTGTTVMVMDSEMDHGPILAQVPYSLKPDETFASLAHTLFTLGGEALVSVIPSWIEGGITPREQDHEKATYTKKITSEDALLDFKKMSGVEIDRRVRTLNPEPGTYTFLDNSGKPLRLKILKTNMSEGKLEILEVQPEGKTPMNFRDFAKRFPQMATQIEEAL